MSADSAMDDFSSPPPKAPYFDSASGEWVLSRYADVLAAFRDPRLWPVGSRGEDEGDSRDEAGRLRARGDVLEALSTARVAEWQSQLEVLADDSARQLPTDRPVDLLHEFAKPVCLSLALIVTGANPGDREQLDALGDQVFAGTGEPMDSPQRPRAAAAVAALNRYFETAVLPMAESTFVGVSQTLPRLMVNGWLALFRHPAETERLRADPDLMPRAVEEMMRYAGIIPRLFRKAQADADLGSVRIAAGERASLMIAAANRDPEHFPDPDRLDVSRRSAGQLGLGIGRSSCAGARLVRMAHGAALGTILKGFDEVAVTDTVQYRTGSGFCWPVSVHVALRRGEATSTWPGSRDR